MQNIPHPHGLEGLVSTSVSGYPKPRWI